MAHRCAVIGGGPAGCAAAYWLNRNGFDTVLFEKAPHVGGRTTTLRDPLRGIVLDTGAGFFTNFYPVLDDILTRCDLRGDIMELMRSTCLVWGDRETLLSTGDITSFARFGFLSPRERLRMARHTAYAMVRYRGLVLSDAATLARFDDHSVATYTRSHLGEGIYNFVVRPGIEPFWYFSCEDVSRALVCALLSRVATARFFTLRSGMDSVCRALAVGLQVHTNAEVVALADDGPGVRVMLQKGSDECFDHVVLATTATVAQQLTANLGAEKVPPLIRHFLQSQRYVPNAHVAYQIPKGTLPNAASSIFPCGPGHCDIAAISMNSIKGQHSGPTVESEFDLMSVFLSAQATAPLLDMPADVIAQRALNAARAFYRGIPENAATHSVHVRREAIPVHGVGRYALAAQCLAQQQPPVVFAGDYLATATVDGALATGRRAAATLIGKALPRARGTHAPSWRPARRAADG